MIPRLALGASLLLMLAACGEGVIDDPSEGEPQVLAATTSADAGAVVHGRASTAGRPSCRELAEQAGWSIPVCELGGNAACGGRGPVTPDCEHCCSGAPPPGPR